VGAKASQGATSSTKPLVTGFSVRASQGVETQRRMVVAVGDVEVAKPTLRGQRVLAIQAAYVEAAHPLLQCRLAMVGLAVVILLRIFAAHSRVLPGAMSGAHCIAATSDVLSLLCAWPFFSLALISRCMRTGALGLVLSTLFGMFLSVMSVVGMYMAVAAPRPLPFGRRPVLDTLEASLGAWDFVLLSSASLHLALCISAWRVYKALHKCGIIGQSASRGASTDGTTDNPIDPSLKRDLSLGEFLCETNVVSPDELCAAADDADPSSEVFVTQVMAMSDDAEVNWGNFGELKDCNP